MSRTVRRVTRTVRRIGFSVTRTLGICLKEIWSVTHQPRLVASLVLGPFLIMLLFGLGYRGPAPEFQTIVVLPSTPEFEAMEEVVREGFGGVFQLSEVTRDEERALEALEADRADVVVIVPEDIIAKLEAGEEPQLRVIYTEVDPTADGWVRYFAQNQTSELNRRILVEVLQRTRVETAEALRRAAEAETELNLVEQDLRNDNFVSAAARVARLLATVNAAQAGLNLAVGPEGQEGDPFTETVDPAMEQLAAAEEELVALQADIARGPDGRESALERVDRLQEMTRQLRQLAQEVERVPPRQLVSPLGVETENLVPAEPTIIGFYTPAVVALLVQHIGVTLTLLSAVRDRTLGSIELFRVSPVGTGSILVGKSLGYGLMLALVSALLAILSVWLLNVPALGNPLLLALSLLLTIFTSVALGLALSVVTGSETQAVQFSLLVLLLTVFLGGFVLPLDLLVPWVRGIAFLLPATYGTIDLRSVMLLGEAPALIFLLGPLALGLVLFAIAAVGTRRQLRGA